VSAPGGVVTPSAGVTSITWALGSLPAGASSSRTLQLQIAPSTAGGTTITNTGQIPAPEAPTPVTATAPPEVRDDIDHALELGRRGFSRAEIMTDFGRPNLVFRVYRPQNSGERDGMALSIAQQIVVDADRGGAGIIYVATRREAERLAALLRGRNIAAQPYHAGLTTETRHHVQELFMQGELQVVVATNAFGMGVDKQEIRFVLHYDHPSSVEAYVQESGREGRGGLEAYAMLLYSPRP